MALRLSIPLMLLSSLKLSQGALAIQRQASSPNEINQIYETDGSKVLDKKFYAEKTSYQNSRTNVEKPNTDDYKLLEIELRDGGERRRKIAREEKEAEAEEEEEEEEDEEEGRGGGSLPREIINFGEILREVLKEDVAPPMKNKNLKKGLENYTSLKNSKDSSHKLYYLKPGKIGVDVIRKRTSWEPRSYLKSDLIKGEKFEATKSIQRPKKYGVVTGGRESFDKHVVYQKNSMDDNGAEFFPRKKYDPPSYEAYTTEYSLPTSSELPKQIPPPPSRVPSQNNFAQTTPVIKFMSRRTDILPNGYAI